MAVDFDLDGANLQFTLTCISTGGPATTITWTRDSITVPEGNETALDNRTTSQYTHTLTMTGRLGGLYTCIVANNRPSEASAQLTVQSTCNIMSCVKTCAHDCKNITVCVTTYMHIEFVTYTHALILATELRVGHYVQNNTLSHYSHIDSTSVTFCVCNLIYC